MGLLTGQGRIGRLGYFLTSVAVVVVMALAVVVMSDTDPITGEVELTAGAFGIVVLAGWLQLMNVVRRLRDLGHPWYWLFISIVPLVGWVFSLYLLFAPGIPERAYVGPRRAGTAANALTGEPAMTEDEAREAYEARNEQLLNDDGSFDMDGLFRDSPIRRD